MIDLSQGGPLLESSSNINHSVKCGHTYLHVWKRVQPRTAAVAQDLLLDNSRSSTRLPDVGTCKRVYEVTAIAA